MRNEVVVNGECKVDVKKGSFCSLFVFPLASCIEFFPNQLFREHCAQLGITETSQLQIAMLKTKRG